MEIVSKAPQEIAAQMLDTSPYFDATAMPESHAENLSQQAKALQSELEASRPYTLSDDELSLRLTDLQNRAEANGVWRADTGTGADERIDYAVGKEKRWTDSEEEATVTALRHLSQNGYLADIRYERRKQEEAFKDPVDAYLAGHTLNDVAERVEVAKLLETTIDIATLSPAERTKLAGDFPSGNFLYHGSGTEQLVQILDSGVLANTQALREREDTAAEAEGREAQIVRQNSGLEGISWSMNGIDSLPGDRYHLAGFVAAPEAVLTDGDQLAVPSRPSPNEVIQIDGQINPGEYYAAKTQLELYEDYERNSVLNGLLELVVERDIDGEQPGLLDMMPRFQSDPDFVRTLQQEFTRDEQGAITFNPDLLSATDPAIEIPIAAIWLQALVESGRLVGTEFADFEPATIIQAVTDENISVLFKELKRDVARFKCSEEDAAAIEVAVERMYLVAPRKDATVWLQVLARSPHKPAGILLYDDKKVRLENFASLHRGDHAELTRELQTAIQPGGKDYIEYAQVLGTTFNDGMRSGHKQQVIAEEHLGNRGALKLRNDYLTIVK